MKVATIVFILLLSQINAFSQNIEIMDRDRLSKSKVRTQTLYEYEYNNGKRDTKGIKARIDSFDTQGNRIGQVNFKESGALLFRASYKYDGQGNKTEYIKYALREGKILLDYKQVIRFDSKGNKLLETGFNGIDSFRTTFNYNKAIKLAEVNFFIKRKLDEKRVFTYTGNCADLKVLDGMGGLKFSQKSNYSLTGKILEEIRTEPDNTVSRRIVYTYDKNDMLATETKYINSKLVNKITYNYNGSGLLTEVYMENADGQKFLINKYLYNDKKWLTEEQSREDNNSEFSKNIYTYDANGICKTIDSYYARYKKQIMSVFVYDNY